MKLQLWLCANQDKKSGIVKLAVTVQKEVQFSTGIRVKHDFKDKTNKGDWESNGTRVRSSDPEFRKKNLVLDSIMLKADAIETLLRQKRANFDAVDVVNVLKIIREKGKNNKDNPYSIELDASDIEGYTQSLKPKLTDIVRSLKGYRKNRAESTKEGYLYMELKLERYLKMINSSNMAAEDFTEAKAYLMCDSLEDEGLKSSSIALYMSYYRDALKQAKKRGLIPSNPLADFDYTRQTEFNYTYLNSSEITKYLFIQHLTPEFEKARDLFRFMCYTSLHWTDADSLTKEDLIFDDNGEVWLMKKRDKTSVEYCQKMHPQAKQIISKYGSVEKLPRFEYKRFFYFVQRLTRLAGIEKYVTPKTARKSFAYMCLNIWGFSLETTAKMMGLNKTDTIAYYAKVGRERVDREVKWNNT